MKKVQLFNRIEFWAATIIFILLVFSLMMDTFRTPESALPETTRKLSPREAYLFTYQLVAYIVIYSAFLLLTYLLVPRVVAGEELPKNLALILVVILLSGAIFGVANTWLRNVFGATRTADFVERKEDFWEGVWLAFHLSVVYIIYALIRYAGIYLLTRFDRIKARYPFITPAGVICFIIWGLVLFMLILDEVEKSALAMWSITVPFGILFYWYSLYKIIPGRAKKKRPLLSFLKICVLILIASIFPVFVIALIFVGESDSAISISVFNGLVQAFVAVPLAWIVFKRKVEENEEISGLKQQLGQSTASIEFLRSQINPHFLFNALNTLYGTAILEGADRTSQGIQQLGDMMRFMFHENMQERIPLSKEIDYLESYINLQCLRTDQVQGVQIETKIKRGNGNVMIAPMLLIPFVENAFKHGVSLTRPSHIYIELEKIEKTLVFTVINSRHEKQHMDPEKHKSGIGLANVRQRLQLMYPTTHTLVIKESDQEFFVKLVLQLT